MLVLFETSAGYAVFKLHDEKKLQQAENLYQDFETVEGASKVVKLKHFEKFEDTTAALSAATAAVEGKMSKVLRKMLKKLVVKEAHEQLAVADSKLGNAIKDKLNIPCVCNSSIQELMRCIRSQMDSLISGLQQKELAAMSLGLAHSLSRYKLKFSPDKVDTMIVQAVSLLDDLDKELNNYIMRCREWYGWHFPELGKIVTDSLTFVKTVRALGVRTNAEKFDFSTLLSSNLEEQVKEAAEISMGTEISEEDIMNIMFLCDQVIDMSLYRAQLFEYLQNRMMAISPNLTVLVGELIGARLISHAGSLINLAKHPASTVQILGAEKALFRALKAKHDTPKYGIIYHAQMVAGTSSKLKGKISRMLAAKCALACRLDALGEDVTQEMGIEHRAKLELRLKELEGGEMRRVSGTGKQRAAFERYESKTEVRQYKEEMDSTIPVSGIKRPREEDEPGATPQERMPKRIKAEAGEEAKTPKKKKKKLDTSLVETPVVVVTPASEGKKKKKRKSQEGLETPAAEDMIISPKKMKKIKLETELDTSVAETSVVTTPKKGKKNKKQAEVEEPLVVEVSSGQTSEKKKKKKKRSLGGDDSIAGQSEVPAAEEPEETPRKKKKKKTKAEKD